MFSTAFLLAASMVVGQTEDDAADKAMNPRQVMNYFVGDWDSTEKTVGYGGRMNWKWDLDHTIIVGRSDMFGRTTGFSGLIIRVWDAVDGKLRDNSFGSGGAFRQAEYVIEPHGDFFKLVGEMTETRGKNRKTLDVVITVQDTNHFTWNVTPQEGNAGTSVREEHFKITGIPLQPPKERPEPKVKKRKQN